MEEAEAEEKPLVLVLGLAAQELTFADLAVQAYHVGLHPLHNPVALRHGVVSLVVMQQDRIHFGVCRENHTIVYMTVRKIC